MNFILDTHTLIWWLYSPNKILDVPRLIIADRANSIYVSVVSAYEVTNKYSLGKWPEVVALVTTFDSIISAQSFIPLDINLSHATVAGTFVSDHRDPFDRIIAAQALSIEATVITKDAQIAKLGARTLW
jgi:PIN domain nuclease of toxin-antitoxin system